MSKPTGTVKFHRVLKTTPEKLYKAFIDPDAMVKFFPPHGFTGKIHKHDPKVGGICHMSFTNFGTGNSHSFKSKYLEMVPGKLLRYTDVFDDPNLAGEMTVTVTLKKVLCGTELDIVQEGIPAAIPTEFCYLGWQETLTLLAHVVEPEIPDGA
jgi:uncharacterized protein YndB with AHSA1/START domain